jgi:hypothetical protein
MGSAALPFVIPTGAKWRDMRFRGLSWKCFSRECVGVDELHAAFLNETAHAALLSAAYRKSGSSPVFGLEWDTTALGAALFIMRVSAVQGNQTAAQPGGRASQPKG